MSEQTRRQTTDETLSVAIRVVADRAWCIASEHGADPAICLAIENLSDDPIERAALLADIKARLGQ
jgi:hypothetical protein